MPFTLKILGTSSALPTSKRFPTAQILQHEGRFFLLDCGEGTQIQIRKNKIKFLNLNHLFISHIHGDHIFGLFGLLSTLSLLGKRTSFHIYAHQNFKPILDFFNSSFGKDLHFPIELHIITENKQEVIYEDRMLIVYSFPLKHSIPCSGFLFKEKNKSLNIKKEAVEKYRIPIKQMHSIKSGSDFIAENGEIVPNHLITNPPPKSKSYAFCTDTRYYEPIIEIIQNVDVLYHESTFLTKDIELAKQTFHSTCTEAAKIALKSGAKKLILGHFSSRYKEIQSMQEEASVIFSNTHLANEDDEIII